MCLLCAIFNVKYWRDLGYGPFKVIEHAPIDKSYRYTTSYWFAMYRCNYSSIMHHFRVILNIIVTLKRRLGVTQGHRKWHHFIDRIGEFLSSIVGLTTVVSCTVFEIQRYTGRQTPMFHTPFPLTCTIT